MFELRSARLFAALPEDSSLWSELAALPLEHLDLLEQLESRFHNFSGLENRFDRLVNKASPNR